MIGSILPYTVAADARERLLDRRSAELIAAGLDPRSAYREARLEMGRSRLAMHRVEVISSPPRKGA